MLIARLQGVGRDHAVDREVVSGLRIRREGLARGLRACKQILATAEWATRCRSIRGTTPSSWSSDSTSRLPHRRQHTDDARVHGLTTGLDPAMTLGCGGFGGNITSDNISPRHLLNIKRLCTSCGRRLQTRRRRVPGGGVVVRGVRHQQRGSRDPIDHYLRARGYARPADRPRPGHASASNVHSSTPPAPSVEMPVGFVCEEDVRQAIRAGQTLTISDKTIVTPSARDLGDAQGVFRHVGTIGPTR